MNELQVVALNPPGLTEPSIAIAAARAGGVGVLSLEWTTDVELARGVIEQTVRYASQGVGIKLDTDNHGLIEQLLADLPLPVDHLIFVPSDPERLPQFVEQARKLKRQIWIEVTGIEAARLGQRLGVDGLIVKGHEAGGLVGDETTFILLQRVLAETTLPVWAHGGIGLHTAAACYAAGAAGVVLDYQLALTRESQLPEHVKQAIAAMDGSETLCLGADLDQPFRTYSRRATPAVEQMQTAALGLSHRAEPRDSIAREWRRTVAARIGWGTTEDYLWPLGQDASFASSLGTRCRTVGGVFEAIREALSSHVRTAQALRPLDEDAPLARSHGTRYPIVQGPMTRVSDTAAFAQSVAEGGGLPFLALALLRAPEVDTLLAETQRLLGEQPWGVGILGFVPPHLRQEQMEVIRKYRPPFALIAGGRPDQAQVLEQDGIPSYLHVPSPGLLRLFLQDGARRFVFEGRECGGHVGPRSSFVLWNTMIDALLEELPAGEAENCHILFAGGIHDSVSAAMVATMAAPLAERGVRIGALMGTAYLFTQEAVAGGAIMQGFQEEARSCQNTALLETGPGHATRCAETSFVELFRQEKRRLTAAGVAGEELRGALEDLNLGRLRIASKGITRHPRYGEDPQAPKFAVLGDDEQRTEGMYMIGQVATLRDQVSTIEELHQDVSVAGTARLFAAVGAEADHSTTSEERPYEVAIVGMSCLLPKANDLRSYWENILNKVDAITEIPADRWDWERHFDPDRKARDKIYSRWGGFLEDVAFDPTQFGIPPNALRSIEPIQLLALEAVRSALHDAGYADRPFPRERTSVILGAGGGAGAMGEEYAVRASLPELLAEVPEEILGQLPEWTEDSFPGLLLNVIAGRVANRFDFGGVNYTIDAACASSLAAVYLAARELQTGSSDVVITGGVDNVQNPFGFMCFSKTQALSPRGRCRTFDDSADGIAISEGVSLVVLKRLADAERDGDRIYAVIKGVAGSSDGRDRSLTAPRPEGQARALDRAYAQAGISPATVTLIEAHGTGTVVGDEAEVATLKQVFNAAEASRQNCAIGSVKTMIGHTKCAAGVAGLMKVALSLYHKVLPPTLGVEKPNTRVGFEESPFYVNTELRPWLDSTDEHPRRAGVSAFGFGGTNFHVVVEEYTGDFLPRPALMQHWPSELLLWSATSKQELVTAVSSLEQALAKGAQPTLHDLAYAVYDTHGRERPGSRIQLAIVATSLEDLQEKLHVAHDVLTASGPTQIFDPRGIYCTETPLAREGKVAFLFPGQGSQYPNMLRDLALAFPEVRETFERADRALLDRLGRPLSDYVFPIPVFSAEAEQAQQARLTATNVAQPALGAADMALVRLFASLGIRPDLVAGHSYGEYVALCAAGAMDEAALAELSEARGRSIVEAAQDDLGVMAAVQSDPATIAPLLAGMENVWLANLNAPKQTMISGTRAGVAAAVERLKAQGLGAKLINVACAFHSPIVAPAQERLAEALARVAFSTPDVEVYSNTTATPYPGRPEEIAALLAEHLVQPVRFSEEIEGMHGAGARVFVEVGPRNVLTGLTRQILDQRAHAAIAVDAPGRPGLTQLQHALGQLAAHGTPMRLDRLFQGRIDRPKLNLLRLGEETAKKALSPTTWFVNGARSRPMHQPKGPAHHPIKLVPASNGVHDGELVQNRTPVLAAEKVAPASSNGHSNGHTHAPAPPSVHLVVDAPPSVATNGVTSSWAEHVPAAPVGSNGAAGAEIVSRPAAPANLPEGTGQVMQQFQNLMGRFLDTQRNVMLSYLQAAPGVSPAQAPQLAPPAQVPQLAPPVAVPPVTPPAPQTPTIAAPVAAPPAVEPEPIIAPVVEIVREAAVPAPAQDGHIATNGHLKREELTARLLGIVAERTGYPTEMLELDLDLEASLGIDSIKRVEILGQLRQWLTGQGWDEQNLPMDKLSGIKTLRGIVELVAGANQPTVTDGDVSASTQAATNGHLKREELTARLLGIVAERTGYPTEMLELDLDLEASLGIDSIKRVEILGQLRQWLTGQGWDEQNLPMDKLSGIKTLRGIVELIAEANQPASGDDGVPAAAQVATNAATNGHLKREELTARLLGIVAERTGYPTEMLELDLDLEASLGIDSIKRVEILGQLRQWLTGQGWDEQNLPMDKLSGIKTLRGIVDLVFETQTGSAPQSPTSNGTEGNGTGGHTNGTHATAKAAPVATQKPAAGRQANGATAGVDTATQRFTLRTVPRPLAGPAKGLARGRTVLITDDETGVAQNLAERLGREGYPVALLRPVGSKAAPAAAYEVNLQAPEAIEGVLERIRQASGPIAGLIHLAALRPQTRFEEMSLQAWRERLDLETRGCFLLAKALRTDLEGAAEAGGAAVIAASGLGGAFASDAAGTEGAASFPGTGALAGLLKTLALEWPQVRAKAVDLDPREGASALAEHLLAELMSGDGPAEVGYRSGQRVALEPVLSPFENKPEIKIERDWVLLVTGGARGITADVAQELAERYQPTLVLAGRSPLPPTAESADTAGLSSAQELKAALIARLKAQGQQVTPAQVEKAYGQLLNEREIRENMRALEGTGARVAYYPVDVRDEQAFGGLIDEIYGTYGRLDGVIHGAGIIEDKLVKDKTVESFDRVVSTKVDSAFVLSRRLRPESLRFLVFFSSVSGRYGNRGQADYAAANEALNKLAVDLDRRWPARVVAMNWGPWKKLGMVSPELEKEFARRGVTLIAPAAGRRALDEEIRLGRKGAAEVVIMGAPGGKEPIAEGPAGAHPLLRGLAINTTASGVEVIRTLDPAHDVYLRDHQLDGKPVLPFAMALELMAEVVQQAWPDLKVSGLRDMQLFKGLVLENGPKRIRIVARAQQDPPAERIGADVSVEITDPERPNLRYYRATVELSDRAPEAPAYAPVFTTALNPFPMSVDDAYRQWLFHGPLFAGITEIAGVGDQGVTATLAPSAPQQCLADGGEGEWLVDPVVFDSGLQLIILWTRSQLDMTSLPARFGRYQRFGSLSAEKIQCHLRVLNRRQEQVLNYNIYFVGSDGRLLGLLEDMECPYSQALNRLAERADGEVASRQALEAAAD